MPNIGESDGFVGNGKDTDCRQVLKAPFSFLLACMVSFPFTPPLKFRSLKAKFLDGLVVLLRCRNFWHIGGSGSCPTEINGLPETDPPK